MKFTLYLFIVCVLMSHDCWYVLSVDILLYTISDVLSNDVDTVNALLTLI